MIHPFECNSSNGLFYVCDSQNGRKRKGFDSDVNPKVLDEWDTFSHIFSFLYSQTKLVDALLLKKLEIIISQRELQPKHYSNLSVWTNEVSLIIISLNPNSVSESK